MWHLQTRPFCSWFFSVNGRCTGWDLWLVVPWVLCCMTSCCSPVCAASPRGSPHSKASGLQRQRASRRPGESPLSSRHRPYKPGEEDWLSDPPIPYPSPLTPKSAPSAPGPSSAHSAFLRTYLLPASTHANTCPKHLCCPRSASRTGPIELQWRGTLSPDHLAWFHLYPPFLLILLLLPLGLQDKDGGLEEDLPLKEAPCAMWCGESVTPGWPGGYNCSGQGPSSLSFFHFLSFCFSPYFVVC